MEKACKDIGEDTETCKMVRSRVGKFPVQRCKQMLEGYDKVLEELKAMEKRNQPLSAEDAV